jgi:hypothetical protein
MTTLGYTEVRKLTLDPSTHPRSRHFLTAASGLVRLGRRHYVIADDEQHLGVFDPASPGPVQLVRLFDGDLPESAKKRKKKKADLESLVHLPPLPRCPGGALLTLGSGSRPNRRRGALLGLDAVGALLGQVKVIDLAPLYEPLGRRFDEVNIEGALILDDDLMLLQRGNKGGPNATVRYAWRAFEPWLLGDVDAAPEPRAVREYDLGAVDGIAFGFTDCAALPEAAAGSSARSPRTPTTPTTTARAAARRSASSTATARCRRSCRSSRAARSRASRRACSRARSSSAWSPTPTTPTRRPSTAPRRSRPDRREDSHTLHRRTDLKPIDSLRRRGVLAGLSAGVLGAAGARAAFAQATRRRPGPASSCASSFPTRRAPAWTSSPAPSARTCRRRGGRRSSSRTGPARRATSAPARSRSRRPTG